jgi:acetylornithine deacetylase/succinyl-diaminopimelate desuccinylase-like protein
MHNPENALAAMKKLSFIQLVLFMFLSLAGQEAADRADISKNTAGLSSSLPLPPLEILQKYIQIPSCSGNEKEAGEYLADICRKADLHVTQLGHDDGNFNFTASVYPLDSGKPNIIFLNHIDVVNVDSMHNWPHGAYSGNIADGEIWGRGAFDNKGIGIMQLHAISHFTEFSKKYELPFNISTLSVSCEETQCGGGAKYVAERYLDLLNPYLIFGEGPPGLRGIEDSDPEKLVFGIAVDHKKAFWLRLDLDIESSGHGSVTPHHYANLEMIQALNRLLSKKPRFIYTSENLQILANLGSMKKGVARFVLKHPRLFKPIIAGKLRNRPEIFSLFSNTVTLTNMANEPGAHNVIASHVTCLLDCRLLPGTDQEEFFKHLRKKLKSKDIEISVVLEMPKTKPSQVDHGVYPVIKKTLLSFNPEAKIFPIILPNFNDSGWFRAKGVPAFDFIPTESTQAHLCCAHRNDEHFSLKSLHEGSQAYVQLLLNSRPLQRYFGQIIY